MPSTAYARKAEDSATWQAGSHRRQTVDALVNALHRLAADGYETSRRQIGQTQAGSHRRQTVDALVNAFHRSTAWQRMATKTSRRQTG